MKQNFITYTDKLDDYVKTNHVIPYRLHPRARYRTNCYYWISAEGKFFKVEEVEYNFNTGSKPLLDHVQIMWMDNLQGYLCTDLTMYDFRLERDKFNIAGYRSIVNTNKSFSGGEIEYWMFIHNINISKQKYQEFWKFIDPNSNQHIDSSKYYFITAKEKRGVYTNVQFVLDPSKRKFKKR